MDIKMMANNQVLITAGSHITILMDVNFIKNSLETYRIKNEYPRHLINTIGYFISEIVIENFNETKRMADLIYLWNTIDLDHHDREMLKIDSQLITTFMNKITTEVSNRVLRTGYQGRAFFFQIEKVPDMIVKSALKNVGFSYQSIYFEDENILMMEKGREIYDLYEKNYGRFCVNALFQVISSNNSNFSVVECKPNNSLTLVKYDEPTQIIDESTNHDDDDNTSINNDDLNGLT
jgi:hypothetical protein